MSAYIVENDHINVIVSWFDDYRKDNQLWYSVNGNYGYMDKETMPLVAQVLHSENVRSVNNRYNDMESDEVYQFRFISNAKKGFGLAEIAGAIDCLEYQSCESDDYHSTDAYKIITSMRKHLLKLVQDQFDFNAIVKMPEEIARTGSGSNNQTVKTQAEADKINKSYKGSPFEGEIDTWAITEAEEARRLKEYGATNWYDWSCLHWGTKWNAYTVQVLKLAENEIHVQFDSAWSPPVEIFDKLAEMFEDVSMVSIDEDSSVEPYEFGDTENFYVTRTLEFGEW
jgi:hypothetical protein